MAGLLPGLEHTSEEWDARHSGRRSQKSVEKSCTKQGLCHADWLHGCCLPWLDQLWPADGGSGVQQQTLWLCCSQWKLDEGPSQWWVSRSCQLMIKLKKTSLFLYSILDLLNRRRLERFRSNWWRNNPNEAVSTYLSSHLSFFLSSNTSILHFIAMQSWWWSADWNLHFQHWRSVHVHLYWVYPLHDLHVHWIQILHQQTLGWWRGRDWTVEEQTSNWGSRKPRYQDPLQKDLPTTTTTWSILDWPSRGKTNKQSFLDPPRSQFWLSVRFKGFLVSSTLHSEEV